jgi:glycosyltransferase involved in cell wall biosynthesis
VRDEAADVLYVNGSRMMPSTVLARLGCPIVFHMHWVVMQPIARWLERTAIAAGRASIIATSGFVARALGSRRVRVVYNGVLLPPHLPRRERVPKTIAILGRIAPEKGQLEFVRAARLLSSEGRRFIVCGAPLFSDSTYMEQVRREAQGMPIEFPGWVDDVASWLSQVDLLVVPSEGLDNIPRVILEAFAAGVPVVAYPSGGIPELVEDGVTGYLVTDRTVRGLARAIEHALASPDALQRVAECAWIRAKELYSLDRFQFEVCEVVEEAVRVHQRRTPALRAGSSAEA